MLSAFGGMIHAQAVSQDMFSHLDMLREIRFDVTTTGWHSQESVVQ